MRTSATKMPTDPFELSRFIDAQEGIYATALAEIRGGRKRSHWMWFIFPQLKGLGSSGMAQRFAIGSLAEAKAYLDHPVLGPRLIECVEAVHALDGLSASEVFGSPDDLKLRSCATLFARASPAGSAFERLLDTYFEGRSDDRTLQLLSAL